VRCGRDIVTVLSSGSHCAISSATHAQSTPEQLEALEEVNLADLPARFGGLDAEMHWVDVLSVGEQQRSALCVP